MANSGIWSQNPSMNSGYPIIADADNLAVCKVSFINEGTTYSTGYSDYAGGVLLPSSPSKEVYGFGGWFTGTSGTGNAFTADTILTSDLEVNAHWYLDSATLPVFEMLGAELRDESLASLRFKTRLYKNSLFSTDKIIEYGTVILPSNLLRTGESLTTESVPSNYDSVLHPGSAVLIVPAINIYTQNDYYMVFTAVLTGIPTEQEYRNISAVAYVKYRDSDDIEQIIYSDMITSSMQAVRAE
jgi:hypothetical protein